MSACKHDEGVFTKRKVSIYQYYDIDGQPEVAEFHEWTNRKNTEAVYCRKCERKIGNAGDFISEYVYKRRVGK